MNILFVNSIRDWGGGEVWLMDVVSGLHRRGHTVTVACRPNTPIAAEAASCGATVVTMRFGGDFDPLAIWKMMKVMKERKIDIVCTNTDKDLRIGGIAGKLAGISAIIPSREIDYPLKNKISYRIAYDYLATTILVNSRSTMNTLLNSAPYLDRQKIKILYKGIDTKPFDATPQHPLRAELGLSAGAPLVSFVGRLDERKGIRSLLKAWKQIHPCNNNAVLLLVGEGTMRTEIERSIRSESLASSVVLTGFRKDIHSILRQSTMLVLPSLWEGFGYVLVEAMAARIPVVATRVSSIPEIVADGESGILVDPEDDAALARAIEHLLLHPNEAMRMGDNGRRIVEQKFTLSRMLDEFEALMVAASVDHGSLSERFVCI